MRRTLRLSVIEGAAWAFMVGLGELFFVADAVHLGADRVFAAAVGIVPLLTGSLGGLAGLWILQFSRRRRPLVCAVVAGQTAVLVALAALEAIGAVTPWRLLVAACAYHAFGTAAGPGWSSWIGQVVPRRLRGRYFGQRNRWIHLCTFLGLLLGGAVLQVGAGFGTVFALAAVARTVSGVLLWRSAELPFEPAGPEPLPPESWRVVRASTLLLLSVSVASPFFAPYMLVDLGLTSVQYALAQAAVIAGKVVSLPVFGARIDRSGPAWPWRIGAVGIAIVPLPWLAARGLGSVMACQALSGASWGAYEVSHLSLMLGSTSDRLRASVFALQGLASGVAMALGTLVGSILLGLGAPMAAVFVASSVLRFAVVLSQWGLPLTRPVGSGPATVASPAPPTCRAGRRGRSPAPR